MIGSIWPWGKLQTCHWYEWPHPPVKNLLYSIRVCLSVCSNMSMLFLREFYNLVLEYMLVSDTPFLLLLFLVPLFDSTNMFSRSRYTFSLSISLCQTSLSATFLFLSLPFFSSGTLSIPLFFCLLCIHILTDILAFSHEHTCTPLQASQVAAIFHFWVLSNNNNINVCVKGVGAASLL